MAKPMKTLRLHYPMIQFLIIANYTMLYNYGKRSRCFWGNDFNFIIPLALAVYEIIIPNWVLRASVAIYHLISNARS